MLRFVTTIVSILSIYMRMIFYCVTRNTECCFVLLSTPLCSIKVSWHTSEVVFLLLSVHICALLFVLENTICFCCSVVTSTYLYNFGLISAEQQLYFLITNQILSLQVQKGRLFLTVAPCYEGLGPYIPRGNCIKKPNG